MSDDEQFDNLDVKEKIKKFSCCNLDSNNNVSKLLENNRDNNISRSMPDITVPKKPPIPPKPKLPPNPKIPVLNKNSRSISPINRVKSPIPKPKPRPFTTDFTSTNSDALTKDQSNRSVPVVSVSTDKKSSTETVDPNDVTNTNKLILEKECDIRGSDFENTPKSSAGISNIGITDDNRTNKSHSTNVVDTKKDVLKKLSAGPPSQPLPSMPLCAKTDNRSSLSVPSSDKTTSIKQRKTYKRNEQAYENNDINPSLKDKNKIADSSAEGCHRGTLDGVIIGAVDDDDDDDIEDPYTYAYEHSPIFRRKSEPRSSPNVQQENIYEEPTEPVQEGSDGPHLHMKVDMEDNTYQDADTNFQASFYEEPTDINDTLPLIPEQKVIVRQISSDSTDDYESPYEASAPLTRADDTNYYDFTDDTKPPVPSHKNTKQSPTQHKIFPDEGNGDSDDSNDYDSIDEDILRSHMKSHVVASGEDDSDAPDYIDPSKFCSEPPPPQNSRIVPPKPTFGTLKQEISDDSDAPDYTDTSKFSTEPPTHQPPPIPSHRSSQNTRTSDSSSDDDDDPEYTDPTLFYSEPPVTPGSHKNRMGSIYQPVQYLPPNKIPLLDTEDGDNTLDYTNPETLFNIKSGESVDDEEIYSDEPLYQVYNEIVNKDNFMRNKLSDDDVLLGDHTESLHFANFVTAGKTATRMLWSELPSVRVSGTLEHIGPKERKRQEAIFEVISSEASYLKSLDILVTHFMMSKEFLPNPNLPSADPNEVQILDRHQYHFLYSGISAVKAASERFLRDLRQRQQQSVVFTSISDIILDYAKNHFQPYVKYCSNQVFQDRTLQSLKTHNIHFAEALQKLESDPKCQSLSMQSFLMLPMQRITRLPLLVDAICSLCEPGSEEFNNCDRALKAINSVVFSCNEGARKMERTEEMYFIQKTLEFKLKPIPLVSASRWLVKKGGITCSYEEGKIQRYKTHLRSIFKGKSPFYLFLFTDLIILTKMRSEDNFKVVDYCERSMLKVQQMDNVPLPEFVRVGTLQYNTLQYAFTLIFLENVHNKTQEYHCFMKAESDTTRWMEALNPSRGDIHGEAIYEEWDCPQVQVVHPYQAGQSDELTLIEGDIISVLRKLSDGWAEGLRLRDDEKGWFPINHTDEIDSKHMRAKNLMQRYRLLNASQNIVNQLSMR